MLRTLTLAAAAVAVFAATADAKRVARPSGPVEKLARAEAVFVGKVSSVEKDAVMLPQFAGDPNKVAHKVAVVQVEKGLLGTDKMTEVKVAFVPPPKADPKAPPRPGRGGPQGIDLAPGQEGVFFLTKHPDGTHYAVTPMTAPLDPKAADYKAQLEVMTKAAAAIAGPAKALKAEKAEDRFLAAVALVYRYRTVPDGVESEVVKVPAEESKLVLKALTEGDWSKYDANVPNGAQAFGMLGLNAKDGWVQPVIVNNPNAPPVDFGAVRKDAFAKWLDGPGKDYQISKFVPKKK